MLSLTLKPDQEQIVIGQAGDVLDGPIILRPIKRGMQIRIGIETDDHIDISREPMESPNQQPRTEHAAR